MPRRLTGICLLALMVVVSTATGRETEEERNGVVGLEDLALTLVDSSSAQEIDDALAAAREAGLSDIQIATAFGLALEVLLEIGPRDNLPVLMGSFETFVARSDESSDAIGRALEAGQNLARIRAEAGQAMIAPIIEPRASRTGLESSPVGGGSSARGATGGGGGGVVSGGASPS